MPFCQFSVRFNVSDHGKIQAQAVGLIQLYLNKHEFLLAQSKCIVCWVQFLLGKFAFNFLLELAQLKRALYIAIQEKSQYSCVFGKPRNNINAISWSKHFRKLLSAHNIMVQQAHLVHNFVEISQNGD